MNDAGDELISAATDALQEPTPPPPDSQAPGPAERQIQDERSIKRMDTEEETIGPDMPSPISADGEKHEEGELPALNSADLGSPSMGYDFSNVRVSVQLITVALNPRCIDQWPSLYPLPLPPSYALAADSTAPSNPSARSIKFRLKSSMSTCENRSSAVIYKLEVRYL